MITLYHSVASRAFVALWMLEEVGVAFRIQDTDIRKGQQKRPEYLKINPLGLVPAIDDEGVIVTEIPAICMYLADRYSYGMLAPKIEDPIRGAYLKWMVFATSVFEPAIDVFAGPDHMNPPRPQFDNRDAVIAVLDAALSTEPYLLGDSFSAADVALGGLFGIAMYNKRLPALPSLVAYNERLAARPANRRARAQTWPG